MKIIVLGGGLVGTPMALDLNQDKNISVFVVDKNKNVLDLSEKKHSLKTIQKDLSNPKII